MSILFHEIQLDRPCGWHGQRWTKVSPQHVIPEGMPDLPENRQRVPPNDAVDLLPESFTPHAETIAHDGENY